MKLWPPPSRRLQKPIPRSLFQPGPKFLRRCSHYIVDDVQLVNFRFTSEHRLSGEKLNKDAGRTPDIHSWAIRGSSEKNLRWTIPKRDDAVGIIQLLFACFRVKSSEPKIGNFQLTVIVEQDIGALDVTVKNTAMMEVLKTFKKLLGKMFDVARLQSEGWMVKDTREVVVHILKDHIEVTCEVLERKQ